MVFGFSISIAAEVFTYLLSIIVFYAGYRRYGLKSTTAFFLGAIYFTGLLENFGVVSNFFDYTSPSDGQAPTYLVWIGQAPLWISFGWFSIILPAFMFSERLLSRTRTVWLRSFFAGLLALNVDALLDPVAVANGLWKWDHPSIYTIGIPITNWIGWVLIASFYLAVFDQTFLSKRTLKPIKLVEEAVFKNLALRLSEKSAAYLSKVFLLRMILFQLIFIAVFAVILNSIAIAVTG